MTWHPLVVAVLALHGVGLALLGAAGARAYAIVTGWDPSAPTARQLGLERAAEAASLLAGAAYVALGAAGVVLVAAIATALPAIVPGAMCGTGVLEATRGAGAWALALDGLAMLALVAWRAVDAIDRARPEAPLATVAATALLVALPAQVAASYATFDALSSLDTHRAVDCCSVVYARATPAVAAVAPGAEPRLVALAALSAVALAAAAVVARRRPGPRSALALAVVALPFTWAAAVALVRVLAAYRYEVLSHACPWCLFLPEHGLAGYPLFGALALVLAEATAAVAATRAAASAPGTAPAAAARVRTAAARVAVALVVFVVFAGWPAVRWYARHGVWMHVG